MSVQSTALKRGRSSMEEDFEPLEDESVPKRARVDDQGGDTFEGSAPSMDDTNHSIKPKSDDNSDDNPPSSTKAKTSKRQRKKELESKLQTLTNMETRLQALSSEIEQKHAAAENPEDVSMKSEPEPSAAKTRRSRRSSTNIKDNADSKKKTPQKRAQRNRKQNQKYNDANGPVRLSFGMKQCQTLLRQLMTHRYGWPFNQPVDPVLLGIPDYPLIIKNPMDLGTIKDNIESGSYDNEDEVAEDVRLVWRNAITYNKPGSDIVVMTNTLSDLFENKFATLKERVTTKQQTQQQHGLEQTIIELRDSMQAVQKELERLRSTPATPSASATTSSRSRSQASRALENRPMTLEEKRDLSLAINGLQSTNLKEVVKIVTQRMPHLFNNGEELELDIDLLDTATLRHLERYIRGVNARRKRRRPSSTSTTIAPKLEQAQATERGTQDQIEQVEARLKELTSRTQAITEKGLQRSAGITSATGASSDTHIAAAATSPLTNYSNGGNATSLANLPTLSPRKDGAESDSESSGSESDSDSESSESSESDGEGESLASDQTAVTH